MKRIDAFLTGKAQARWPEALVYEADGRWFLDRGPRFELAELGDGFFRAREALRLILRAEAARENEPG